jgi:hypothetical protein
MGHKKRLDATGKVRRVERAPLDDSEIPWEGDEAKGWRSTINGRACAVTPGANRRWHWVVRGAVRGDCGEPLEARQAALVTAMLLPPVHAPPKPGNGE